MQCAVPKNHWRMVNDENACRGTWFSSNQTPQFFNSETANCAKFSFSKVSLNHMKVDSNVITMRQGSCYLQLIHFQHQVSILWTKFQHRIWLYVGIDQSEKLKLISWQIWLVNSNIESNFTLNIIYRIGFRSSTPAVQAFLSPTQQKFNCRKGNCAVE